jgi:hypothetical protein
VEQGLEVYLVLHFRDVFMLKLRGRVSVEHGKETDVVAPLLKVGRHGVSDDSPEGPPDKTVGTVRVDLADLLDIIGCHLLDRRGEGLRASQAPRLYPIDRMANADVSYQPGKGPSKPCDWMNAKQRRPVTA